MFVQPTLIFPWPAEAGIAQELVREMEADMPMAMVAAYFKRMIPSKAGGYRVLRFQKDWRTYGKGVD